MTSPKLTFAAAYEELQTITREFEQGELDLEKSIPRFKRATELVTFLKKELAKMENQIEEINVNDEPNEPLSNPEIPEDELSPDKLL